MTSTSARAEQIAAFYTRHADHLRRIVAAKVNAPAETIEDACQTASAALVRRDDVSLDHRGVKWLATVAIHEGWRLVSGTHDVPMGAIRAGLPTEGELLEPEAAEPSTDEQALARIEHAQPKTRPEILITDSERRKVRWPPFPAVLRADLRVELHGDRLRLARAEPSDLLLRGRSRWRWAWRLDALEDAAVSLELCGGEGRVRVFHMGRGATPPRPRPAYELTSG
jgi:hypothetical protein